MTKMIHPITNENMYTTKELSRILNKAIETLIRWRSNGGGPGYIKLGGRYYYLKEDIKRWLEVTKKSTKYLDTLSKQ